MLVLGVESSCDESSVAVVEDGRRVLSNEIASQIDLHRPYDGVVPEIASRMHTEWIVGVAEQALKSAGLGLEDIDAVAVTNRPGLVGSLLVGLNFAKGLALARGLPFVGVDHILAHLYAPHLERRIEYPYLGLLVSGGHTVISRVDDFDQITVLGTTIDDACGEAFDKVAKHYQLGYPGGVVIDRLSQQGYERAFDFPDPSLHKGHHPFDVSYSGLKTAVINQLEQFWDGKSEKSPENIAASFQRAAIGMLVKRVKKALLHTGLKRIVAGGGVAANSRLRRELTDIEGVEAVFPALELCTDNAAMIAGLGYHYLRQGSVSDLSLNAYPRIKRFKRNYP
ncbi:MAG TPA: tRNA (adenosine(37)-N6)-threonylcarbamoyltransferase complex transferase subunit TsaD [Sediminispirochaeta sp.]|nr:tRNA (adenosine(37)-N6)-threonylcarbamoyltransferase complex transferase subunit TsaD [Sediminispirochaeta sp.]